MLRALGLLTVLILMWWLWSGHATPLLLGFGLGSCLLVCWIALRMDVVDRESTPLHLTPKVPRYWAWLCWQILLSNIETCGRILRPSETVDAVVSDLPADQNSDLGRVIYANSITLTPGTLSMQLDEQSVQVHALSPSLIEDLVTGDMAERIKEME